jgi:hypothetical protein
VYKAYIFNVLLTNAINRGDISRHRAAAGPELKFRAGVEATAGEVAAATTSGAGLAKMQSKVFDPGGEL